MAQALAGRDHRVTLLVPSWDWPADAGRSWVEGGVSIECLPLPARVPVFFHLALTTQLVQRALASKPDVIHIFKPKGYTGLAHWMLIALRRLGRNIPHLVLDTDDWEQAWNSVVGYPRWQQYLFSWQEHWGLRHADAITVASLNLQELATDIGVPRERIFYVPNGISPTVASMLPSFSTSSQASGGQEGINIRLHHGLGQLPVVLLYTRFAEVGLSRLVDLIDQLAKQAPTARWLVVGRGFAGEEKVLVSQLKSLELDQFVVFAGQVPAQDLPHYFAAADVAAYPFDNTPINQARCSVKLTDLLTACLPVVTDAVGQNKVYILDGETGLLVSPGDTTAFVSALVRLLSDDSLRRRLGTAARQRMLQHFTWPTLVEAVEDAYHWELDS
jgi:glycosyltransferase involved in cell wall biosynthesis